MKQLIILILFAIANTSFGYSPPDSCLKIYYISEDSTFTNPYNVRVDSCDGSPTFGEYYAKGYFSVKFDYNIIPRSGLFPEDTLIEYSISDIDTIYNDAIIDFQNLETQYGSFKFIEEKPHLPDTTTLLSRKLSINFDDFVNIESADKSIESLSIVKSVGFANWFIILSNIIEFQEDSSFLRYNTQTELLEIKDKSISENELIIYNIRGIEVLRRNVNSNISTISLESLSHGIYLVIYNNRTTKLIK